VDLVELGLLELLELQFYTRIGRVLYPNWKEVKEEGLKYVNAGIKER
jgi:hypothetical protein